METLKAGLDYAIFGTLGLMSFVVVACAVERHLYFRSLDLSAFHHREALRIALTVRLTTIASMGYNAPYVGLLGTVLGILVTFHDLGSGGALEARSIMRGLALALEATAAGLVVAIPAVLLYNGLLRRVEELTAGYEVRWSEEALRSAQAQRARR